jgi:hypothetical protein
MIPDLAVIISTYCIARLIGTALPESETAKGTVILIVNGLAIIVILIVLASLIGTASKVPLQR